MEIVQDALNDFQNKGGEGNSQALGAFENLSMKDIIKSGKNKAEFQIMKQSARTGNVNSQILLGETYFFGDENLGIDRNYQEAMRFIK